MTDWEALDLLRFCDPESTRMLTAAPWLLRPGVTVVTDGYMGLRLDGEYPGAEPIETVDSAANVATIDATEGRRGRVGRTALRYQCPQVYTRDPVTVEPCIEYGEHGEHTDCQWLYWLDCFAVERGGERHDPDPRYVNGVLFDGYRIGELLTTCPEVDTLDVLHSASGVLYLDAPGWRAFLAPMKTIAVIEVQWDAAATRASKRRAKRWKGGT